MAGSRSSCQYSQKLQPDSRLSDVVRGFPRIPSTAGRKMNRESPMPKSASKATQQNFLKFAPQLLSVQRNANYNMQNTALPMKNQ